MQPNPDLIIYLVDHNDNLFNSRYNYYEDCIIVALNEEQAIRIVFDRYMKEDKYCWTQNISTMTAKPIGIAFENYNAGDVISEKWIKD